jgi:hypothetical protein
MKTATSRNRAYLATSLLQASDTHRASGKGSFISFEESMKR